ncbi:MAG: hypothetical protein A2Z51_02720 [Deltaproteobacteria bacterium RBG_19FT_COMBO_52_11]|nr:MAG: hypothetical protein A2Z51_02720 [Deltaproteobacteria bacterium RBG_19FT_COMBO_52_11]
MPLFGPGGQIGTRRKHRLGCPLAPTIKACFLRRRRGGIFPAPSTEKSAPHDSPPEAEADLAPRPWNPSALVTYLSSKN